MAYRVVIFSITIICLAALFYSFMFVKLLPSQQVNSKLTGFPVWHGVVKSQASASWFGFLIILILGSTITSLTLTHKKSIPKTYISYFIFSDYPSSPNNNPSNITTKSFNKSLAYYTFFTFISTLSLYILESGKLWSSFSSYHNLLELIIILFLSIEGQIYKNKFIIFFISLTYIVLVNLLTILLEWPLDAVWFKLQGLVLDFALAIVFFRIYHRTYLYMEDQKSLQLPTNNTTQEEITSEEPNLIDYPNQVILLPLAALLHTLGNLVTLFINNATGEMVIILSNAVTFTMYSFYIYLDTHYTTSISNSKNIVLPYTPIWKFALIFLCSIIPSVFILRLTIYFF